MGGKVQMEMVELERTKIVLHANWIHLKLCRCSLFLKVVCDPFDTN